MLRNQQNLSNVLRMLKTLRQGRPNLKLLINLASSLLLVSCLSSTPPKRNFKPQLWRLNWRTQCAEYKHRKGKLKGKLIQKCYHKRGIPYLFGISEADYLRERNYQLQLQNACIGWR